jgi:hypothetical protein
LLVECVQRLFTKTYANSERADKVTCSPFLLILCVESRWLVVTSASLFAICTNHGLDRYRRQGIVFDFDAAARRFRYDGAAFREILRRYPRSPEASEARARLGPSAD